MFLERIVTVKQEEVVASRTSFPLPELKGRMVDLPPTRDFLVNIRRQGAELRLIAEIKRASPSRGVIRKDFDPQEIARAYQQGGAAAISVLTDSEFFQGSPTYLQQVRQVTTLPLLRKDFIIDQYQIYQSRLLGADAILLIVALLQPAQLAEYLGIANLLGLASLVEVHHAAELELALALATDATIIGINNRDLHSFQVSLQTTFDLCPAVPHGQVVVSESGISQRDDLVRLAATSVDAVLVGEVLMASLDPVKMLAILQGK